MPHLARVLAAFALWAGSSPIQAQQQDHAAEAAARLRHCIAEAIRLWVGDYANDRLRPDGPLREDAGLQPGYAHTAIEGGAFAPTDPGHLSHLEALQKLLVLAEHDPDEAIADAVLEVAAAGFDKSLVDRDAVVLRDLGHWTLMRMDHRGVWFLVMRAAAGERLPLFVDRQQEPPIDTARRVAALKLLGMKRWPVFRGTIEDAAADYDPRVRLASIEAIEFQRRPQSLGLLVRVLGVERHPIVAQAVVHAVAATLNGGGSALPADERDRAIRATMRLFGLIGWRTDMDLIASVVGFPHASAVPPLIEILARKETTDALETAVNRSASPLLRSRAYDCLRGLTGAVIPMDQPQLWREFWAKVKDEIVIPTQLPSRRHPGNTASTFFGIPVQGREIAFLIDTSGSMDEQFAGTTTGGRSRRDRSQPSRLMAAKEQLLQAVQVMAPESRYHVLTFADRAQDWSRKPVPPTPAATRSLVELLAHFHAEGGTNVYEGLVQALALDQLHFGQEAKLSIDELFVLSDGEPTQGLVKDPDEILRLVREANRYLSVRINCVFTGSGVGAGFLKRLAEENGGVFVQR